MLEFDSRKYFCFCILLSKTLWNAVYFPPLSLISARKLTGKFQFLFDNVLRLEAWCPLLLMLLLSREFSLDLCTPEIIYRIVCVCVVSMHFLGREVTASFKRPMPPIIVIIPTSSDYLIFH